MAVATRTSRGILPIWRLLFSPLRAQLSPPRSHSLSVCLLWGRKPCLSERFWSILGMHDVAHNQRWISYSTWEYVLARFLYIDGQIDTRNSPTLFSILPCLCVFLNFFPYQLVCLPIHCLMSMIVLNSILLFVVKVLFT